MPRILLNLLSTGAQKTGIGHYSTELLRCLRLIPGAPHLSDGRSPLIQTLRSLWARASRLPATTSGNRSARRSLARMRQFLICHGRSLGHSAIRYYARYALTSKDFDLYHEPNFIPLPCDLPTVATLHDLSVILHPEWHPLDRVRRFERYFSSGLARCQHFFAISDSARLEIIQTLGIPANQITRTYMGIRPGLSAMPPALTRATLAPLELPKRYLLYLGTIEPRKNVLRLLQAYCALPSTLRSQYPLLLVGGWGWNTEAVAAYYFSEARHRGVIHLGYLADNLIPALYCGATALVFPSLYEGFGLPPVEMTACGGAVLASRIGPHIETVGSHACLIDPEDTPGWIDAMTRVLTEPDWRRELQLGTENRVDSFTWEACAATTLQVYHSVLGITPEVVPPSTADRKNVA